MEERRSTIRHRVYKAASIEFDSTAVDCLVRNLSTTGAMLNVDCREIIPHCFTLEIRTSNIEHQNCAVVWREENRIGLMFELAV